MSKGSKSRPLSISQAEYEAKYETLFGKRKKPLSNPDPAPSDPEPIADEQQDIKGTEQGGKPPYDRRRYER